MCTSYFGMSFSCVTSRRFCLKSFKRTLICLFGYLSIGLKRRILAWTQLLSHFMRYKKDAQMHDLVCQKWRSTLQKDANVKLRYMASLLFMTLFIHFLIISWSILFQILLICHLNSAAKYDYIDALSIKNWVVEFFMILS